MIRKQDSELQVIQKEISRQIRKQLPTVTTTSTVTFAGGGGTGGGISGSGTGGGTTVITINVYGAAGAMVGATTLVNRSRIDATGMVWIQDDPGNIGVIIHAEVIQDPMYWATMSSI